MSTFSYITSTPIFSIAHLGEIDARSYRVVYAGGGGASRSGVTNTITAADVGRSSLTELCMLDTGQQLCSYVCVGRKKEVLVCVFNNSFCLCKLVGLRPGLRGQKQILVASNMYVSDMKITDPSLNSCAVDADDDLVAAGGDDGMLRMWTVSEARGRFNCTLKRVCSPAHAAPITDCCFSESSHLVATASKDGSCRIWSTTSGAIICELLAISAMCGAIGKQTGTKLIVRACKFVGDDSLISVQSAARGSAFAAKWNFVSRNDGTTLTVALVVSRRISGHPVSAVCLRQGIIAHGNVEGLVGFIRVNDLRQFGGPIQVHDLPVTSLVAAIKETTANMPPCALSVSADYKLAATPLIFSASGRSIVFIPIIFAVLTVLKVAVSIKLK